MIAKADDALTRSKSMGKTEALKLLTDVSDELTKFRYSEFTVSMAFQSDELAKLQDELEARLESMHRAWSNLSTSKN
jgi:hypothetical protein